ncbi:hypothetical protein [Mucilaginibacter myungsuensis]|uniref:Uncharacterized protein n=1 Tax=Mucilaginibacter myungsuensis TaxID=649104 RepID=A0A929L6A7_9SPHI|nr:hypothetical protein [Mucilaginibacter myungsuensis]MBE9663991.1 hypothetical protein [Mucilaginibacter myungsuensis]MDN3601170.1 hypothetical protein [Mucilaginibacter myungsuensis]
MKKLLFLCLPVALLYACGDKAHKTDIEFDKSTEGLHILKVKDTFNVYKGSYFVLTDVKNDTKDTIESVTVDVNYVDQEGDIVAQSNSVTSKPMLPGETVTVENKYDFGTSENDRPYKIQVKAKSMF